MIYPWPDVLIPLDPKWSISDLTRSGGRSLAGAEQLVASSPGRVMAAFSVRARTPVEVRAVSGLLARLQGRLHAVLVPACEVSRAPSSRSMQDTPFSDGALFSDGTGMRAVAAPAVAASSAAEGAARIRLQMRCVNQSPAPGSWFGVRGYCYRIATASAVADMPGAFDIVVTPPFRAAVQGGDELDFARPKCTMALAESNSADDIALELNRFGTVRFDFLERLPGEVS